MTRPAFYNEIDPYCAQWLRNLVAAGHIPPGDVDDRDIREIDADDLRGYGQIHLFAGLGGFAHAARLAGLRDDFPILTGGFPCQPFSCAGERRGISDDRHLWPEMCRLVAAVRPAWVLGENVAGLVGMALDGVLFDLEGAGYACWPALIPACAVDAPHRRDRVWIVGALADANQPCASPERQQRGGQQRGAGGNPGARDVEHAPLLGRRERRAGPSVRRGRSTAAGAGGVDVGDTERPGLSQPEQRREPGPTERGQRPWSAVAQSGGARWLTGADGKARRVPQPGLRGVADGLPAGVDGSGADDAPAAPFPLLVNRYDADHHRGARIARLKALGNAIVPQVAAELMRAMPDAENAA